MVSRLFNQSCVLLNLARTCFKTHGGAGSGVSSICFSVVQLSFDSRGTPRHLYIYYCIFLPVTSFRNGLKPNHVLYLRQFNEYGMVNRNCQEYLSTSFSHQFNDGLVLFHQIPFHLVTRLWDTYLAEGDSLPDFLVYIFASFLLTVRTSNVFSSDMLDPGRCNVPG